MIVDSHGHTFPFLGEARGFENPRECLGQFQRALSGHHQPARRLSDNAIVPHTIWSQDDPSPAGYEEVSFRFERFGRALWTKDGVDYYKQIAPPSLVNNDCTADYLVAEMDYAGVDWSVLQNDILYGKLNDFLADCARQYPDRLLATAHVDEAHADQPDQLAELRRTAEELGMKALFYGGLDFWLEGYRSHVDDERFEPFWSEVERQGMILFWACGAPPNTGLDGYLDQMRRLGRILDRHPGIAVVMVGGSPVSLLNVENPRLPEELTKLVRRDNFCMEVVFPIGRGGREEYPYPSALRWVRRLYEECGPRALVWGSDMPFVLRHCTFSQSLEYLRKHADFMPQADLDLILGGNLARMFGLEARVAGSPAP